MGRGSGLILRVYVTELNYSTALSVVQTEIPTCWRLSHRQPELPRELEAACSLGPPALRPRMLLELSALLPNRLIIPHLGKTKHVSLVPEKRPVSLVRHNTKKLPALHLPCDVDEQPQLPP